MAGKYRTRLDGRDVYVTASLPSDRGVEYIAEKVNFSGQCSMMKEPGLYTLLFKQGLAVVGRESRQDSCLEYSCNDNCLRGAAAQESSGGRNADLQLLLDSREKKLRLKLSPRMTDRRDETELFGYAAVILNAVAGFVGDERNFISQQ